MNFYDVIIVGSGPAGVSAAYPLVKKGLKVAIIDGGLQGSPVDVFQKTNQILKIKSNIKINQSLAKGGLSEVWPGICDYFTKDEITKMGLPANEVFAQYKEIANLINLRPSKIDINCKLLLESSKNVYRLLVAQSCRTSLVIDEFKKFKNFEFIQNQVVKSIKDKKTFAEVENISINEGLKSSFKAKIVILAAGSLNTVKILLKSFNLYNYKVPFLTKCNYMFVCLQPKTFIKARNNKAMISQVAISEADYFIQFYKCSKRAFEKVNSYVHLPKQLGYLLFKIIAPFLVIADVRFTTPENPVRFLRLKKGDILEVYFHQTKGELENHKLYLRRIKKRLFGLGLIPFKMLYGDVTSHYANGVPTQEKETKLSADQNGKLSGSKSIYIADSSTWRSLPGKPHTFTIMANALRIGKHILEKF